MSRLVRAVLAVAWLAGIAACAAAPQGAAPKPASDPTQDFSGPLGAMRAACAGGDGFSCEALGEADRPQHNYDSIARDRALLRHLCERFTIAGACVALGWLLPDDHAAESNTLYTRACAASDQRGCSSLAESYELGRGVARDDSHAAALYGEACHAGYGPGCFSLARMIANGRTVGDAKAIVELDEKACEKLVVDACVSLASALEDGHGAKKDELRSAALYEEACASGSPAGCNGLGRAFALGRGVKKNELRAADILRTGCARGFEPSCTELASLLANAADPIHDDAGALALFDRACDENDASACTEAGRLVAAGRGTNADWPRAATLWSRACDGGHVPGCTNLGFAALNGRGISHDVAKGASLLQRGCDHGDNAACNVLGIAYAVGEGVPHDDARAEGLFRSSCERGSPTGCSHLGLCYKQKSGDSPPDATGLGQAAADCKKTALACDWLGRIGPSLATEAFGMLVDSCSDEIPAACNALAGAVAAGRVPKETSSVVLTRIRSECDHGKALWCRRLGYWYEEGLSVAKSAEQGRKYYKKACDAGDARACSDLGRMIALGSGGKRDVNAAVTLLRATCNGSGEGATACGHLGMILVNDGKPEDHAEGSKLLERACDAGDALACHRLGGFYAIGAKGFPHDDRRAATLYEHACTSGGHACEEAKKLRESLGLDELVLRETKQN